ncbi:hypothetical protein DFH06DRAFT_59163 [Mycena polygramma]|nr:hypothetical protein DFH06DRAFT_59163 [Mycena polygramma]
MPLEQNGIVDAYDGPSSQYNYPFCRARFFPSASFPGLQVYENDGSKCYDLVTHGSEARVYTEKKDRETFLKLHPSASVSVHCGLYSVGRGIRKWCLQHRHEIPQRRSTRVKPSITTPYNLTTYDHGVQQFRFPQGPACMYKAAGSTLSKKSKPRPAHVQGTTIPTSSVPRTHTAAPVRVTRARTAAAPYPTASSTKTASRCLAVSAAEVTTVPPRRQYIGKPLPFSRVSASVSSAVAAPARTPVASGSDTTAAANGWFVTSEGDIFRDAAHAEAAAVKKKDIKLKIVPDLKTALAWCNSHTRSLV